MKLILHVGVEKTGTTAIQKELYLQRDSLLDKGILYPNSLLWGDRSHHKFSFSLLGLNNWGEAISFDKLVSSLDKEVSESKCKSVVISSELLRSFYAHENFIKLEKFVHERFNSVCVVIVFREQVSWFSSVYNQNVKDPVTKVGCSFGEFLEKNISIGNFYSIAKGWKDSGIAKKIITLSYSRNICHDFFKSVGLSLNVAIDSSSHREQERVNTSLNRPHLDLVRHFNRFSMTLDSRRILNDIIQSSVDANVHYSDPKKTFVLSKDVRRIKEAFKRSNELLADEFGVKLDLPSEDVFPEKDMYSGVNIPLLSKIVVCLASKIKQ